MTDMRQLISITESYIKNGLEEATPYVPGSEGDPNLQWKKTSAGLARKPGSSLRWKIVPVGQEWGIQRLPREDQPSQEPEMMTQPEWRAGTGMMLPQMAYVGQGKVLLFPEKETAERALFDYEVGMHKQGYTP